MYPGPPSPSFCVGVVEKGVGGGGLHEERNALAALAVAEPLGVDHLAEKEGRNS